jgi:acyl-ACP thioesterase
MSEFVPRPAEGRRFSHERRVRLSDAGTDGALRLDGVARYLQDVATDDWGDSGLDPGGTWVVRRTEVRVACGGRWPQLGEQVTLTTWCGGTGPAWAERRTDLEISGQKVLEAVALWVSLDRSGRPVRLDQEFRDVYGLSAAGRRVSSRVPVPPSPKGATSRPWPIRNADLDVLGHVNNAAVWAAVSEITTAAVTGAALTHHGAIEGGDAVSLFVEPGRLWLVADGEVRAFAEVKLAP